MCVYLGRYRYAVWLLVLVFGIFNYKVLSTSLSGRIIKDSPQKFRTMSMDHNTHNHDEHMGHMMPNVNMSMSPVVTHTPEHDHANHDMHDMTSSDSMGGHMMHNMDGMGGHMMMKMYFHCSSNATILFSGWQTTNWQQMFGSCIAVFFMAALYEGLKVGREFLLRRSSRSMSYNAVPVSSTINGGVDVRQPDKVTSGLRMLSLAHGLQTLLHLVQIVISYFLMLIFMTYNVWLCISVALGATTGYFFFSWKRAIVIDINEHCH